MGDRTDLGLRKSWVFWGSLLLKLRLSLLTSCNGILVQTDVHGLWDFIVIQYILSSIKKRLLFRRTSYSSRLGPVGHHRRRPNKVELSYPINVEESQDTSYYSVTIEL